eukprot:6213436-Pleurochrysis_carterae.AAC.5
MAAPAARTWAEKLRTWLTWRVASGSVASDNASMAATAVDSATARSSSQRSGGACASVIYVRRGLFESSNLQTRIADYQYMLIRRLGTDRICRLGD